MALSNGKQGHCLLSKASRASLHCVTCVEDKDDEQRQGRDWKGYDCQPGRWQPLCLKLSLKLIVVRFRLHAVLHVVLTSEIIRTKVQTSSRMPLGSEVSVAAIIPAPT